MRSAGMRGGTDWLRDVSWAVVCSARWVDVDHRACVATLRRTSRDVCVSVSCICVVAAVQWRELWANQSKLEESTNDK